MVRLVTSEWDAIALEALTVSGSSFEDPVLGDAYDRLVATRLREPRLLSMELVATLPPRCAQAVVDLLFPAQRQDDHFRPTAALSA